MAIDPNIIAEKLWGAIISYGPKLVLAILVLVIGFWIIRHIGKVIERAMIKKKVDKTLRPFLKKLVTVLLKVMLLISVASMVGIAVTSFIAILGALGLAVGLALQGSLANFAGGVLILLFKPFEVGHFIEAQGVMGTVDKIEIFHTTLKTPDNKIIIVPNGPMANGNVTNFSREETRRLDMTFGIGYGDDIDKARKAINDLIKKDKRILKKPAPAILLSELADSSVNFAVRVWLKGGDYWPVKFEMTENVKKDFDKKKIGIPYPQMDVHLHK